VTDGAREPVDGLRALPAAHDEDLLAENAAREDWIARNGRQRREVKGVWYKRTAGFLASKTDPDSSPMKRRENKGSHLGYYAHYAVDVGKARIIVNALVSPFEVSENAPMLDLLWRSIFRWRLRPAQVTGDMAYGTTENIATVERAGIRAYVPLTGAGKARPFFSKEEFAYDPERDLYRCPVGETLLPRTKNKARRLSVYKAKAGTCEACELRPKCTDNKTGRQVLRYFDEAYVDRVRAYRGTFPYEKALRKRRVWVEPLFAEAKDRHGLRRFRLRRLEKVNAEALWRLQRLGVHDLLGRLPDLREVLNEGRLVRHGVRALPVDHRLVHPAPVEVGANRPLEVIDEGMHLLVRRSPVEVAVLVRYVAVERDDRRVDQLGHGEPPFKQLDCLM